MECWGQCVIGNQIVQCNLSSSRSPWSSTLQFRLDRLLAYSSHVSAWTPLFMQLPWHYPIAAPVKSSPSFRAQGKCSLIPKAFKRYPYPWDPFLLSIPRGKKYFSSVITRLHQSVLQIYAGVTLFLDLSSIREEVWSIVFLFSQYLVFWRCTVFFE